MSILGNPFRDYVKKQVETRQRVLGKQYNLNTSDLQYYNSKTPWIRLASSVDLFTTPPKIDLNTLGISTFFFDDKIFEPLLKKLNDTRQENLNKNGMVAKLKSLGFSDADLIDNTLAKKFILFGGSIDTSGGDGKPTFQGLSKGIYDNTTNTIFNSAYGWGGIEDRGFVPMPGITQASVEYLNNGALAKTTVNIKCWSKNQMALIDALYLHPGYTLLLEFGWSMYLDNDTQQIVNYKPEFNSPALDFLFNPGAAEDSSFYTLYQEIQKHKKDTDGNYEGIVGKITKFKWNFNKDGSYDCQVELVSYGSIIESLLINTINSDFPKDKDFKDVEEFGRLTLKAFGGDGKKVDTEDDRKAAKNIRAIASTTLGYELLTLYNKYSEKIGDAAGVQFPYDYTIESFPSITVDEDTKVEIISDLKFPKGVFVTRKYQREEAANSVNFKPNVFITFGTLLAIIQSKVLLYDYNPKGNIPIFYFDFDFKNIENSPNYITRIPGQLSCKPDSCFITVNEIPDELGIKYNIVADRVTENTRSSLLFLSDFVDNNKAFRGRLANIYISLNTIIDILLNGVNNEGTIEVTLQKFLEDIIREIQTSLGGINDIQVIIDNETGAIKFIDRSPVLVNDESDINSYTRFNIFGVQPDTNGSFVRELSLNSELSNEYATQMSIGASNGGFSTSGGKTGAFSQYNLGLKDRVIPFREDFSSNKTPTSPLVKLKKLWEENKIDEIVKKVYDRSSEKSSENLDSLSSNLSPFFKLLLQYYEEQSYIPPSSVLPFNLSLELDGISGMRLFEKFYIDKRVLPPNYEEDEVNILIKGINHTVTPSAWTTKLETLYAPNLSPPNKKSFSAEVSNQTVDLPLDPVVTARANAESEFFGVPLATFPASPTRLEAMRTSFNKVFASTPEQSGLCARYVYNLALNYCRALKGNSNIPGQFLPAGGNANNNQIFWLNLQKLGYTKKLVWQNGTKSNIINILNTTTWGYGDIVVYYCNDGNQAQSHVRYGHTQIYVGDSITPSRWATSEKNNYGDAFIYNSRTGDKWDLYVFRAPATADNVKLV